jgi:hypothetical protein
VEQPVIQVECPTRGASSSGGDESPKRPQKKRTQRAKKKTKTTKSDRKAKTTKEKAKGHDEGCGGLPHHNRSCWWFAAACSTDPAVKLFETLVSTISFSISQYSQSNILHIPSVPQAMARRVSTKASHRARCQCRVCSLESEIGKT